MMTIEKFRITHVLFYVLIVTFLADSNGLSTPVKAVTPPSVANIKAQTTQPIDLILSSGFCAFARQAGDKVITY